MFNFKKITLHLLNFFILIGFATSAQATYKSGIDLELTGTEGADWYTEELYHNNAVFPKRIIYLKANTQVSLKHNNRNVVSRAEGIGEHGSDNIPNSGDEGIIRYKIDRERSHQYGPYIGNSSPSYPGPFSFSTQRYPDNSHVVGGTGDNGAPSNNPDVYWTKGTIDDFGDEWHSMLIWDDDSFLNKYQEYKASDGTYNLFVVAPKTPCIKMTASDNGQFYTTPAKNYWVPKIFKQTTYIQGNVSIELRDINGNNVYYIITNSPTAPNSGYTDAGSNSVTLQASTFSNETSYLHYYYHGNSVYTKTRKIVKPTTHPSSTENHGNILWETEAGWQKVADRWNREPYSKITKNMATHNFYNKLDNWTYADGWRKTPETGIMCAMLAKKHGLSANQKHFKSSSSLTKPFSMLAKEMVIDNSRTMDATGYERNWPGDAIPNKEQFYRGYWDVNPVLSTAFSYDILIDIFNSNEDEDGITPVEDYFIRDSLASWAWESMQVQSDMVTTDAQKAMWGSMRSLGGAIIAIIMPNYSTEYYGTSGFGNNQQTYEWCPYPDTQYTWKEVLYDHPDAVNVTGYPNLGYSRYTDAINYEDALFGANNAWVDKPGYLESMLCRRTIEIMLNIAAQHKRANPSEKSVEYLFPNTYQAFKNMTQGLFYSRKGGEGPYRLAASMLMNPKFPEMNTQSQLDWIKNRASKNESEGTQLFLNMPYSLVWYDDELSSDSAPPPPPPPSNETTAPVFTYENQFAAFETTVSINSNTSGSVIYYTTDGSIPNTDSSTYLTPLTINQTSIVRAMAKAPGKDASEVVNASFVIGEFLASNDWQNVNLGTQQNTFSMEMVVECDTVITNAVIGISDGEVESFETGSYSTFDELACIVRFFNNGIVDVRNGGIYEYDTEQAFEYEANTPYRVRFEINVEAKTYDVYIKTAYTPDPFTQLADDYQYRTAQQSVTQLDNIAFISFDEGSLFSLKTSLPPTQPTNLQVQQLLGNSQ